MIHRRSFLAAAASLSALALPSARQPALGQPAAETTVTFVHVNDISQMAEREFPDGRRRGGFARLAAVVKAERARHRNVIVSHGGDTLSPSLLAGLDRGAHIIHLLNLVAPDVFAPGNHEFDFGKATFLQRMAEATFPRYAANLRDPEGRPLPGFRDRAIVTFDGVRIGLTGLAYDKSPRIASPEDLRFASTIETTKAQDRALRAEGADFTVAVMHVDRGDSLALQFARAADLLLTGHTHDLFVNFDGLNAIVESSFDAQYVVAVDVAIRVEERDGKRVATWWPQYRVIDTATVTPDPEVAAVVEQYQAKLDREMDTPIGVAAVELDSRNATVRTGEAVIGNLFADAVRAVSGAEVAILNGGGIRGDRVYPSGSPITRKDILAELPFGNRLMVVEATGRMLREAMENGLRVLPYANGRFPQVSGMAVTYAAARPPGARVVAMQVAGAPLDEARLYRLATSDFLLRGGDDYTMFRDARRLTEEREAPLIAAAVIAYIERQGTLRPGIEGRLAAV